MNFELNWTAWHEYALLGVDALCATLLYAVYRKRDRIIKNILEAPDLPVGSDLFKDFLQGATDIPYAVVKGRVKDMGQTIESSAGLKTVMQVVTLNEHSYRRSAINHWYVAESMPSWGDSVRTIHQAQNAVPFALGNLADSEKKFFVEVVNPFDATDESLFLTISTNFTPTDSSLASTFMGFFTGVAVRGTERTEEVLPIDTVVTGIGRIIKDSTGNIKLVSPSNDDEYQFVLSTLPVESIVRRLESRNFVLKMAICVVASVGAIVAVRRAKAVWKDWQMNRMREAILKQRNEVDLEGLNEFQICTICLLNPREVILLNCGHVCVCADCCLKLNQKCPVCRSTIISTHPAFIV